MRRFARKIHLTVETTVEPNECLPVLMSMDQQRDLANAVQPSIFTAGILPVCDQNRNRESKHSIHEIRQKFGFASLVQHVRIFALASRRSRRWGSSIKFGLPVHPTRAGGRASRPWRGVWGPPKPVVGSSSFFERGRWSPLRADASALCEGRLRRRRPRQTAARD